LFRLMGGWRWAETPPQKRGVKLGTNLIRIIPDQPLTNPNWEGELEKPADGALPLFHSLSLSLFPTPVVRERFNYRSGVRMGFIIIYIPVAAGALF